MEKRGLALCRQASTPSLCGLGGPGRPILCSLRSEYNSMGKTEDSATESETSMSVRLFACQCHYRSGDTLLTDKLGSIISIIIVMDTPNTVNSNIN